MGEVHQLLSTQGRDAALRHDLRRDVVEAAAGYMASEDQGISFLYSGWAQLEPLPCAYRHASCSSDDDADLEPVGLRRG